MMRARTGRFSLWIALAAACAIALSPVGSEDSRGAGAGRGRADGTGPDNKILDIESGTFAIDNNGRLMLRPYHYDLRAGSSAMALPGSRLVGVVLMTSGTFEIRHNNRLALYPDALGATPRGATSAPPPHLLTPLRLGNILGAGGWYEMDSNMRLVLYPVQGPEKIPPWLGSSEQHNQSDNASSSGSPWRLERYFINSNGFIFRIMEHAKPINKQ